MSSSEQQESSQLTRKQLREIRLTGATAVITEEEAAAAAATAVPAPATPAAPILPRAAEPVEVAEAPPADESVDLGVAPLTRRQARAQERIRTASVPVITPEDLANSQPDKAQEPVEVVVPEPLVLDSAEEEPVLDEPTIDLTATEVTDEDDAVVDDDVDDDEAIAEPVAATPAFDPAPAVVSEVPRFDVEESADEPVATPMPAPLGTTRDDVIGSSRPSDASDASDNSEAQRPTVSSSFGRAVHNDAAQKPAFTPSFDELLSVNDSTGSQHVAPNALIFTQVPGGLSGTVPSTGEILITGTYALPEGLGSRGHAHGVADGKEVDAVLIDGELAPASSPTPIAASAAVSTIKPAGEVIRPPAPEKGNKLMLTLAITAGGLALALAAALIFAFTTGVLG